MGVYTPLPSELDCELNSLIDAAELPATVRRPGAATEVLGAQEEPSEESSQSEIVDSMDIKALAKAVKLRKLLSHH